MKYFAIIVVVLAIFGGAIWLTQARHRPQPAEQPAPAAPAQNSPAPATNVKTYTSDTYKFSFQYPGDWILQRDNDPASSFRGQNYFARFGQTVVTVTISQDAYPKTNFTSAYATFAVNTVIGNEQDCATYTDFQKSDNTANPLDYRSLPMDDTKTAGGTKYYYAEMSGAAAGTRSDTRIYHVLRNGMCYEANLNLFTTNIGNYEPGTVTAVDEAAVWKRLEDVLAAVKL